MVKQGYQIMVSHPNTTMGFGDTHRFTLWSAMDVDHATQGIDLSATVDSGLVTAEPENTAENPVTLRKFFPQFQCIDFSGCATTDKDAVDGTL